ncbi:hypothetical protein KC19_4G007200 [Ceratodon purpureus]|uniref:Heterokaryon incompatibility domain-containing protein n=1 Tax=Ceratodon purpureus TaxID=3225 RepID=A0A8T0I548_CERPU|nr:hypothetical protein KC19_4G007200 [Ceratodon purpureus]KAG0578227.1 hypothetical protein KC19_4G007200 [Ceratodon purpureus]KAG0578228.1 hypothetical protein KC19_4G007200 [Ceratodon purpureus]KAG0578229.1 hypothetical protein KC19_4G007200 [Ceratodon purpureus]
MDNPTLLYNKSAKTLVNGADISNGVDYTAISHTWSMWDSTSKGILGIHQHDGQCEGTANFHDMLDFVNTEWLWVDTLCISESSKATEIPKMRKYYRNAQVVLVVLDTSKGEYDLGLLKVDDFGNRLESRERLLLLNNSPERISTECKLSEEGVALYNTLCQMFKASWFTRGWTLQELLLAKDVVLWNGSSSIGVTDVNKCLDWMGIVLPDVVKNGLQLDSDYSRLRRIFHWDSRNISYDSVDGLMSGRNCTKDEDYVYSFLGLLDIEIKVEYGIRVEACKKRLFRKLVEERRAASVFSHSGVGVFPIHSEYGTSFALDNPRSDRAVYSVARKGVQFSGCNVYIYEVIGIFATESFRGVYPERSLWKMTRILGMDVSAYKDLVKAMYSSTGPEDGDEFLDIKSKWFLEIAKLSAGLDEETLRVPQNFDCLLLHSLLAERPQTPLVSYGMVHNNESVCAYVFACLEDLPKGDGRLLLLAPGIVGEVRETGILCSGLNLQKNKQRKIGATLNLGRHNLSTIEPLAHLPKVSVISRKYRNPKT